MGGGRWGWAQVQLPLRPSSSPHIQSTSTGSIDFKWPSVLPNSNTQLRQHLHYLRINFTSHPPISLYLTAPAGPYEPCGRVPIELADSPQLHCTSSAACPWWCGNCAIEMAAFVRVSGPANGNFLIGYPGISATMVSAGLLAVLSKGERSLGLEIAAH